MDKKEIYDLLDNGWIYCLPASDYFENRFFSHIGSKDKKKFGNGYFIRKSKSLYDRLVSIGMPKNSDSYDGCIVIVMSLKDNRGFFNLMSLRKSGESAIKDLEKVAEDILNNGIQS